MGITTLKVSVLVYRVTMSQPVLAQDQHMMAIQQLKRQICRVRLLAAVCLLPLCIASLCPSGQQYWSTETESCVNCSRCDSAAKQVVIRPCQVHKDTLCGPLSDLNIDWSWLKPRVDKHTGKHHGKHIIGDMSEKKHHKKDHKPHFLLDDDMERTLIHHSALDEEVEVFPAVSHHGHKHHKSKLIDEGGLESEKKPGKKHNIFSKSLLGEDFDPLISSQDKMYKLPPPPPLKSADDLEKQWKEWLIRSKNMLQHRKDDLLKNLHKESPYNENHYSNHKLNHPSPFNSFDDSDGEIFHHSAHHKDHNKEHFSPLDLQIFDKLFNHEHKKHQERVTLSHLLGPESKHTDLLDMMKSEEHKHDKIREQNGNDLAFPMDSFDFQSAVPTHRLFLGEPSTISEMMDEDLAEDSEDERLPEDSNADVVAVPFTAAERLVWDWQAVALASAVSACLLFFAVVAGYSILHVRQWRRLKTNFDADVEELSAKVGLMSHSSSGGPGVGASAAEATNTNLYLEKLLENKKTNSNIYTQKRPHSYLVTKVDSPS